MALPKIFVEIGAKIDGFEKEMGAVSKRLNAIDREAQRAFSGFSRLGERLTTVGTGLTAAITLPLAAAGAAATKFAVDFDSEMRKVTSLLRGSTQRDFEELSKATLAMSRALGVDAVKSAQALYEAISAGVPKENVIDFVTVATKAAIAGATDTKVAVDALTTITAAYGLELSEAGKVSDALFQAVNVGKFQFEDLAKAIGPAAQQASNLGITYQELLAATSTLSLTSGGVSIAVTQIESAMRALISPTKEMQAGLQKIGFETGSAAIKTLGFEGTLQALREATGGSVEAFNALFGRIEGATGALGLTGEKAVKAAQDYTTLKEASSGLGATQDALAERNKSAARQFEQLAAEAKAIAIQLGTAMLPAVKSLLEASRPLVDVIAGVVQTFSNLPGPMQAAIGAIVGLAAAAGPLLLIAGSLVKSFALVAPAITSLTGALGIAGGAGLTGAMALAGPLAIAFGVAIAGWAILKAVSEIQRLNAEFERLDTLLKRGNVATEDQAKTIKVLEGAIAAHNKVIGAQQVHIESTGKSVEEYIAALIEAVKQNKIMDVTSESIGRTLKGTASAMGIASRATEDYGKTVEVAEKRFVNALRAYQQGRASLEQVTEAQVALWRAQDAADPRKQAERFASAWEDAYKRYDKLAEDIIRLSEQIKTADGELAESAGENSVTFQKAHEAIRNEAAKTVAIVVPLNKRLPEGIQEAIKETEHVRQAYETLGQKTPQELAKIVEASRDAWEKIVEDSGAQSVNALEAWIKYETARQEAARRSGEVIPEAQRKALEKAQQDVDAALGKQKDSYGRWSQQVSTIINDLGRDLARGTIDLFKGLFGFDDVNKKLKADSEALKAELAARTDALAVFQDNNAAAVAAVQSKYAEQLANETEELRRSLEQRQIQYEQFVEGTTDNLNMLRAGEAERLFAEQHELAEKLRMKEADYEEYISRVIEKEQEIRAQHATQLAGQLRDLEENLRDRTQSYDDFVADANVKLGRIGVDLAETIEDATRSINRRIEDENEDYADDTEKIRDDLRKAEKKGDQEQVRVLQRSLEKRESDHNKSIRRLQEDLAEQVSDAKRRAEQQTQDLNTQLSIRKREHAEYVQEIITKQAEVTEKHRVEQEAQLFDLQQSIDKRTRALQDFRAETAAAITAAAQQSAQKIQTAEQEAATLIQNKRTALDAFETDINTKIDAITAHFKSKTAEETTNLQTELGNRVAEYEKFKNDIVAKINQLELDAKTPLERVGDLFKGVAGSVTEALLRLGSEELWGSIIAAIKNRLASTAIVEAFDNFISGIAAKLAGALGFGAADAVGGAAQAGGAAGQVGGALGGALASTGLSATLGAVFGGISAVSGIIGNFQMRGMNATLDLIEESTRFTAIGTVGNAGIIDTLRTYLPWLESIQSLEKQFIDKHAWRIHDVWEVLYDHVWPLLEDIRKDIRNVLEAGPSIAFAGSAAGGITINFVNTTFANRGDIDYAVQQIGRNLR